MKKTSFSVGILSLSLSFSPLSSAVWAQSAPLATPSKTAPVSKAEALEDIDYDSLFDDYLYGTQEENDKAVAEAPNNAWAYITRGDYYLHKKIYDKALADFTKALALEPKSVKAQSEIAQVYRAQKDVKNALSAYEKAIALDAPKTDALRARGDYFAELGINDKALADYNRAIELQPDEHRPYLWRALFFVGQNQYDKALLDYNKIVELRPGDDDFIVEQAEMLRKLKRYNEALIGYQKALDLNPKRIFLLNEIANTYWEAGAPEKALETFNKAVNSADNKVLNSATEKTRRYSYLNRGLIFYVQGKRTAALDDLNKAIEMETARRAAKGDDTLKNTVFAQAYFYRSLLTGRKLSITSKEADEAQVIADATKAVQLDATLSAQYLQQATSLLGNVDAKYGALAWLSGVAAAKPNDIPILMKLGEAQQVAFRSSAAIQTYSKILAIEPQSLEALSHRANAYAESAVSYKAAAWLPAVADWKSYLTYKPGETKALSQLGLAQYNAAQTADGIATFRQILATDKENAYAHMMLGLGLAISGDKGSATGEVQNYLKKLTKTETPLIKSNFGNAKTHFPLNETLKTLYELIPEEEKTNTPIFFL